MKKGQITDNIFFINNDNSLSPLSLSLPLSLNRNYSAIFREK